jgi:hypothetical protein
MSEASQDRPLACPQCGARLAAGSEVCWLCGAAVAAAESQPPTTQAAALPAPPAPVVRHAGASFSLGTLFVVMTLVAICCGLFIAAPGLGITVCIVLAPVLVRTAMVVNRREAAGRPVSMAEKAGLIFSSLLVAHVILAVVIVAAVGSFCAVCLSAGTEAAIPFAIMAAAIPTILVLMLMVRWVRARYRRAIEGGPDAR